jgi:hypothetical protein
MRRPQIERRSSKRPVRQYVAETHHDRKSFAEMKAARRLADKPAPVVPRSKD